MNKKDKIGITTMLLSIFLVAFLVLSWCFGMVTTDVTSRLTGLATLMFVFLFGLGITII